MIEFNAMYDEKEPNPAPRKDGHLPHPDEWEDEDSDVLTLKNYFYIFL